VRGEQQQKKKWRTRARISSPEKRKADKHQPNPRKRKREGIEDRAVDFYWRPGCPYCFLLERRLRRRGVSLRKYDIWQDDKARALVRKANNGNETVPTLVVGETVMVNPAPREVFRVLVAENSEKERREKTA